MGSRYNWVYRGQVVALGGQNRAKSRDLAVLAYTSSAVFPLYGPTGVPKVSRVGRENTETLPTLTDFEISKTRLDFRGTEGTYRDRLGRIGADWGICARPRGRFWVPGAEKKEAGGRIRERSKPIIL